MTPTMILILGGCVVAVIFAPVLWSIVREQIAPIVVALGRRSAAAMREGLLSSEHTEYVSESELQDQIMADNAAKQNAETAETPRPVAENSAEVITFGETQALARLIVAGKLGLTDAVKIGADAKSGEKYQRRSREIKAAVDQLREKYPQRTPEQEQLRKELGLQSK